MEAPTIHTMQEFYDRWAHQDPHIHLSPSLPERFLFRFIKDAWFEMAEEEIGTVEIGKRILVREIIRRTDHTVMQYGSEWTEKGWTRHMVAFRQGEESPFPLPTSLAVPTISSVSS